MDPPYLNSQISDYSDLEEDVQYPQNLLEAEHKVYRYMAKNEQDTKVKHPSQLYTKYRCSLKHHSVMAKLIFSIAPNQVENEHDFSIAIVFSRARQLILSTKNLAILTFINKILQLHEQLNNEDVKYKDINLME